MTAGQTWPGVRVDHFPENPCEYFGPTTAYTGGVPAVFFLKPNSRDEGIPARARSVGHVCSPPHTFVEEQDGSLTIQPSISNLLHGDADGSSDDGWHGYLEHGVWRQV